MDQEKKSSSAVPLAKETQELMRNMSLKDSSDKGFYLKVFGIIFFAALLGIATGYLLGNKGGASLGSKTVSSSQIVNKSDVQKGMKIGINDTKMYKDTTEGVLKKGGVEGEGQYHLERPGGSSQTVYLTSAVVDLSKLEGRKIKVWGATQAAHNVGWLMDVGQVEVLE